MEVRPAGTQFAAECAVALVNEVWSLLDLDADSAAEAGELQHSRIIYRDSRSSGSLRRIPRRLGTPAGEQLAALGRKRK